MVRDVSDSTIEQVMLLGKPVIVDVWAPWCGPCKSLTPIIESLAEANPEVEVCKLNLESNPDASLTYKINSIPVILFFKNGALIDKVVGLRSQKQLQAIIDEKF